MPRLTSLTLAALLLALLAALDAYQPGASVVKHPALTTYLIATLN